MFTGIIQKTTKVKSIKKQNDILSVSFELPKKLKLSLGASVSINGICSTVTKLDKNNFAVEYMKETVRMTTVEKMKVGLTANFENSLKVGDSLDGHFVYGHIDAVGIIKNISYEGDSTIIKILIPNEPMKYVVYKGSIAVDGVSLTVSKKNRDSFEVSLIPYTLSNTNLGNAKVGDRVNIETDILGKYILGSM